MKYLFSSFLILYTFFYLRSQSPIPQQIAQYKLFNVENGLPSSTVVNIGFDEYGFLIIKANDLFRFDGSNFTKYRNEFLSTDEDYFFQNHEDGSILFSSLIHNVHFIKKGGELELLTKYPNFGKRNQIVLSTSNGYLYLGRERDLLLHNIEPRISKPIFDDSTYVYAPHSSTIAADFVHLQVSKNNHKNIAKIGIDGSFDLLPFNEDIVTFFKSSEDQGYGISNKGLFRYNFKDKTILKLTALPSLDHKLRNAKVAKLGNNYLVISLDNRIFLYDETSNRWTKEYVNTDIKPFVSNDFVNLLVVDQFLNIYANYNRAGLLRIQKTSDHIKNYITPSEEVNFTKQIIINDQAGTVLQVTANKGARSFPIGGEFIWRVDKFRPTARKNSICFAAQVDENRYFFINEEGYNSGNYFTSIINAEHEPIINNIESELGFRKKGKYYSNVIFEDESVLQVGLHISVLTFNKKDNFKLVENKILANEVCVGIYKVDEEYWQLSNSKVVISNLEGSRKRDIVFPNVGIVRSLHELNDSIKILGTDKGIVSININNNQTNHWPNVNDCIYAMIFKDNDLWCSTDNGIIQVRNRATIRRLSVGDGIQGKEFNTNSKAIDSGGRFYFGGVNGISSFHPDSLERESQITRCIIPYLTIDNNRIVYLIDSTGQKVILKPGERAINLKVSTLGQLSTEHYITQYAIPGQTPGWINAGSPGIINHSFGPGNYKLYYDSGTYFDSNAPLTNYLEVIAQSYWYQSNFFYFALLALLSAFIIYILNQRNRSKLKDKLKVVETKEKVQYERDRIARELHDNIGVQVSIVNRNLDWIISNLDDYSLEETKKHLLNINDVTTEINQNLRDTIWVSKKEMHSINDVLKRISVFIYTLKNNVTDVTFHFSPNEVDGELTPSSALNFFRIVQESLHNSIKHSKAKNVWISIKATDNKTILLVKDDGIGFDITKEGMGYGIKNMEKRAADSEFEFFLHSDQGEGCEIELIINQKNQ